MFVQSVDYHSPEAAWQFTQSLRETGFAVLRNHPLPSAMIGEIYSDWAAFFKSAGKDAYRFDPARQDGWFPPDVSETAKGHTMRDLKEFFHVYTWGRIPVELREGALRYHFEATQLAAHLLAWIEQQLPDAIRQGLSEPLSDMIQGSEATLLRVLHYPPLAGDEPKGALRAAPHEDINLITILPAASAPGLQVMTRAGEWLDVPVDPGALVINVGDMLQEATGGWLPSTPHRVVNPAPAEANLPRLSLPLFLHPRAEVVLSSRYTAQAYLDERLRELGVK
ncbi:MAG: isopenicillin N synthase family oxygenase [Burkholderiales bacterium]|nr:isopenicillin N synthase family oxygenase [Burkholderiales bacterium]